MNKRTTVRLPSELLRRARQKAASEGRTLTALIEEGLRYVVPDEKEASKRERRPVRVSKASGGLLPGVDPTRMSDIQEADDLEYVERMKHFK